MRCCCRCSLLFPFFTLDDIIKRVALFLRKRARKMTLLTTTAPLISAEVIICICMCAAICNVYVAANSGESSSSNYISNPNSSSSSMDETTATGRQQQQQHRQQYYYCDWLLLLTIVVPLFLMGRPCFANAAIVFTLLPLLLYFGPLLLQQYCYYTQQ